MPNTAPGHLTFRLLRKVAGENIFCKTPNNQNATPPISNTTIFFSKAMECEQSALAYMRASAALTRSALETTPTNTFSEQDLAQIKARSARLALTADLLHEFANVLLEDTSVPFESVWMDIGQEPSWTDEWVAEFRGAIKAMRDGTYEEASGMSGERPCVRLERGEGQAAGCFAHPLVYRGTQPERHDGEGRNGRYLGDV